MLTARTDNGHTTELPMPLYTVIDIRTNRTASKAYPVEQWAVEAAERLRATQGEYFTVGVRSPNDVTTRVTRTYVLFAAFVVAVAVVAGILGV